MAEWCMAHPWMTFSLIMTALIVGDNILSNILKIIAVISSQKSAIKLMDRTEGEEKNAAD